MAPDDTRDQEDFLTELLDQIEVLNLAYRKRDLLEDIGLFGSHCYTQLLVSIARQQGVIKAIIRRLEDQQGGASEVGPS